MSDVEVNEELVRLDSKPVVEPNSEEEVAEGEVNEVMVTSFHCCQGNR